jgi:DNA polymerase-3 subunit alpha
MQEVIPLFKSHYSIGRSILTLNKRGDSPNNGPDSILDICADNKLSDLVLVEDNMSGFLEAYFNSQDAGVALRFGLRLNMCNDYEEKNEESLLKTCKYIIFCKNNAGYEQLVKIFSFAAKDGFYYRPRLDFKTLSSMWTEDLKLAIPFYDSFIFNNVLMNCNCVPEIDFTKPELFLESNGIPFDSMIEKRVKKYAEAKGLDTHFVKSIFYKNKKDFKSYMTFRCINNRSTLNKPRLDHMCSNEFCFESFMETQNA